MFWGKTERSTATASWGLKEVRNTADLPVKVEWLVLNFNLKRSRVTRAESLSEELCIAGLSRDVPMGGDLDCLIEAGRHSPSRVALFSVFGSWV